jgi:hypothetical protein
MEYLQNMGLFSKIMELDSRTITSILSEKITGGFRKAFNRVGIILYILVL